MLAASLNKVLAGARVELGLYGLATLVIFRTSSLPVRSQTYSKCSSGISGSATAVGRKTHTFVPPDCRRRSRLTRAHEWPAARGGKGLRAWVVVGVVARRTRFSAAAVNRIDRAEHPLRRGKERQNVVEG